MNFNILIAILLIAFPFASFSQTANIESSMSTHPILSAMEASKFKHIKTFLNQKGNKSYSILLSGKWEKGICDFQGHRRLYALFADLNFDGNQDIWITGYSDSQGRGRCSDVWLFNPITNTYEYNKSISTINNLEVAPIEKRLEGGIFNCGCAGQCFFHDSYEWELGTLVKFARRQQDCRDDSILYQESALINGTFQIIHQVKGMPDKKEYIHRQNGELHYLRWDKYPANEP